MKTKPALKNCESDCRDFATSRVIIRTKRDYRTVVDSLLCESHAAYLTVEHSTRSDLTISRTYRGAGGFVAEVTR